MPTNVGQHLPVKLVGLRLLAWPHLFLMRGDPITQKIFECLEDDARSMSAVSRISGVRRSTIYSWKVGDPGLANARAVLNAVGYDFQIVKVTDDDDIE